MHPQTKAPLVGVHRIWTDTVSWTADVTGLKNPGIAQVLPDANSLEPPRLDLHPEHWEHHPIAEESHLQDEAGHLYDDGVNLHEDEDWDFARTFGLLE